MDIKVKGAVPSMNGHQVHYVADDPLASYTLTRPDAPNDYNPAFEEWVHPSLVDYNLIPQNTHNELIQNQGLPTSFMQIQSVADGSEWYKNNSKYPDLVCDMLARYEWGDLRYTTKKEFKNLKKKTKRKKKPKPTFTVKRGPVIVDFPWKY